MTTALDRRDFLKSAGGRGRRPHRLLHHPRRARRHRRGRREVRAQRLHHHHAGRARHRPRPEGGDGAGSGHRARPGGGRGAGDRLEGHADRLPDGRSQVRPHAHGRELEHQLDVRQPLARRRRRPHGADRCRRQLVEGAGERVRGREERGAPPAHRARPDLRRDRGQGAHHQDVLRGRPQEDHPQEARRVQGRSGSGSSGSTSPRRRTGGPSSASTPSCPAWPTRRSPTRRPARAASSPRWTTAPPRRCRAI